MVMRRLWIDGAFSEGSGGRTIQVVDPATEEVVDVVPKGGTVEVERAVAAARRAFPAWKRVPALERAGLLEETARRLRGGREDLALTLTRETGRTLVKN